MIELSDIYQAESLKCPFCGAVVELEIGWQCPHFVCEFSETCDIVLATTMGDNSVELYFHGISSQLEVAANFIRGGYKHIVRSLAPLLLAEFAKKAVLGNEEWVEHLTMDPDAGHIPSWLPIAIKAVLGGDE